MAEPNVIQKTARGALYAASGQSFLFLLSLGAGILLARLLSPTEFGIYAVISFLVLKLNALAQFGLNASLIHDNDSPSPSNQRSVFTLHCLIVLPTYLLLYLLAPWLTSLFQLGPDAIKFCRLVGLIILIQPLSSIPIALLSRRLRYDRLTLADLAEGFVYQGAAITLALLNFSYWSFGLAALISIVVRALLLTLFSPWPIGLAWNSTYLRRCVRFGGTLQLSSLTSVARDNISTLLGGPLFGPATVGLLTWSSRLAWMFSQSYVSVCTYIAFPSLSRMRSDPMLFAGALTKMLRYVNLVTLLSLSLVAALAPEIVHFVFTDKWAPAIPLFYFFAARMVAGNYTTLLDLGLKAQGRPERSLKILFLWTLWEWALALVAVVFYGYLGIAISYAIGIWFALFWLYREVSRLAPIDLGQATATPMLCAVLTFLSLYWAKGDRIDTLLTLLVALAAGALLYSMIGVLAEGRRFWRDIRADLAVVWSRQTSPLASPITLGE